MIPQEAKRQGYTSDSQLGGIFSNGIYNKDGQHYKGEILFGNTVTFVPITEEEYNRIKNPPRSQNAEFRPARNY